MKKETLMQGSSFVAIILVFFGIGFYIGGKTGFDIFQTQVRREQKALQTESQLRADLSEGRASTVFGRIQSVGSDGMSIVFRDYTLGAIFKAVGGFVERTVLLDDETVLVQEEASDGPHFLSLPKHLRPGQSVSIYFAKGDFKADNAVAKEIIILKYMPLDIEIVQSLGENPSR